MHKCLICHLTPVGHSSLIGRLQAGDGRLMNGKYSGDPLSVSRRLPKLYGIERYLAAHCFILRSVTGGASNRPVSSERRRYFGYH